MPEAFDKYLLDAHTHSLAGNELEIRLTALFLKELGDNIKGPTKKYEDLIKEHITKTTNAREQISVVADVATAAARLGVFFAANAMPVPILLYLDKIEALDAVLELLTKVHGDLLKTAIQGLVANAKEQKK